jgi:transposase
MNRAAKICAIPIRIAEGYTDREIMYDLDIPKRTYYRWKSRMSKEGHASVVQMKKPGPEPMNLITDFIKKNTILWRDKYGWGPCKIAGHFKAHHDTAISHHQIYKLLVDAKKNKAIAYPRRIKGRKRFERKHSMSLLHADWKDTRTKPMLTFLDDHSRFILESKKFDEATMENSIRLLESAIRKFGNPEQLITDRGAQFWNNHSDNPTDFTQFCTDKGIEHIKCSKSSPQANGKLEAFHGRYDEESWRFKTHGGYIKYWNYKRPHEALEYLYPCEVFDRDKKCH